MLILHDLRCADYGSSMRPEQPARVTRSVAHLRAAHPDWIWRVPAESVATDDALLLAHAPAHLKRLSQPRDFDADTPYFDDIGGHARRAVAAALEAARHALERKSPVFSLMRPPGHHATAAQAMGFCYLNQIAITALYAQKKLGAARVAVWDFDAHHGNGTEAILDDRPGFLFCSVHQFPGYPGTGTRNSSNCNNWSVPPLGSRPFHLEALEQSWNTVLSFRPELILISAGFDAYVGDPVAPMSLEIADFATLGRWTAQSGIPSAAVLEGGYSEELPLLLDAYLGAWDQNFHR